MKTVHYGDGIEFELTDEEFNSFGELVDMGKNAFIKRLGVILSKNFIWAGEKPESKKELTKGYLHDGLYVEKRFGHWVDPTNPEAHLDYNYYPELTKDLVSPKPMGLVKNFCKHEDIINNNGSFICRECQIKMN